MLKAAMTRLVRRLPDRQVVPGRSRAEHPQHAVHHRARVLPRSTATIGTTTRPKDRFEDLPLGIGEVHTSDVRRTPSFRSQPLAQVYEIGSILGSEAET